MGLLGDEAQTQAVAAPMSSEAVCGATIVIEEVHRRYDPSGVDALRGVSLRVAAGDFVAVTGPSGSGKSTLLHLIATLDHPSSGRIIVDGVDTASLRGNALAAFRREHIGLIFQRFHLLPGLTALENVMAPLLPYQPTRALRERAAMLLARVRMEHRARHVPGELSGGEQQRIAIARALIANPRLLLADEPTGSLDSKTGFAVMDLLQELQAGGAMTLVVATHDPRVAARAPHSFHIDNGSVATGETV
ncbi:MAG TPA: ABC transporter ATP-binding protein [Ktedonobacterales bacterium]|nr:ABC transporter ATP-binding protein [Ktedonobacterales bacterium]